MGLGVAALNTSAFAPVPGPPFPASAAENGLSVDPGTGAIVLGNDTGGVLATLLSNREIPLDTFTIAFLNAGGYSTFFYGDQIEIFDPGFNNYILQTVNGRAALEIYSLVDDAANILLESSAATFAIGVFPADNQTLIFEQGANRLMDLSNAFNVYRMGDLDTINNGMVLNIDDASNTINMGDIFAIGNTTVFTIDNSTPEISATIDFNGTPTKLLSLLGGVGPLLYLGEQGTGNYLGTFFGVDAGNGTARIGASVLPGTTSEMGLNVQSNPPVIAMGDLTGAGNQTRFEVDDTASFFGFGNATNTASIVINGVNGFTGTVAPVNSITVNNGIVTNVT